MYGNTWVHCTAVLYQRRCKIFSGCTLCTFNLTDMRTCKTQYFVYQNSILQFLLCVACAILRGAHFWDSIRATLLKARQILVTELAILAVFHPRFPVKYKRSSLPNDPLTRACTMPVFQPSDWFLKSYSCRRNWLE